jgi:hypothetical protein
VAACSATAQRIVRGQHVAELVDAQTRAVRAEEHRHEARILTELEPLDLQVMLGDADARPAGRIARARILTDLVQHALVEHGSLPAMPRSSSRRRPIVTYMNA